jgi:hypothetical protein
VTRVTGARYWLQIFARSVQTLRFLDRDDAGGASVFPGGTARTTAIRAGSPSSSCGAQQRLFHWPSRTRSGHVTVSLLLDARSANKRFESLVNQAPLRPPICGPSP